MLRPAKDTSATSYAGSGGNILDERPSLGEEIATAKALAWKGSGELPQLPWKVNIAGTVLVVDLWSGFGGALMAMLSLGIRVIAVALETNKDCTKVAAKNLQNIIHAGNVEQFNVDCLLPILEKRNISAIFIGGGSPCQGNSFANKSRKGLGDERSLQPQWLARHSAAIRALQPVRDKKIGVITWLENVASGLPEVLSAYDELLGASRIKMDAGEFGYVRRNRCFWAQVDGIPLCELAWTPPPSFDIIGRYSEEPRVSYNGTKPIPSSVKIDGGF